jgi:hypothetical protein
MHFMELVYYFMVTRQKDELRLESTSFRLVSYWSQQIL